MLQNLKLFQDTNISKLNFYPFTDILKNLKNLIWFYLTKCFRLKGTNPEIAGQNFTIFVRNVKDIFKKI